MVDEIHDEFVEAFVAMTRKLRIGDGMAKSEIGPLVSSAARDRVQELVHRTVDAGAQLQCGGQIPAALEQGWYYEPTILTGVQPDMAIMQQECFGPVASICRVADFDTAIRYANESPFGLGAAVFTSDFKEAMQAADELKAGAVWVNNPLLDNDALSFGGWRNSGLGRELGSAGLDAFRQSKMVFIDPAAEIQEWWYPYEDSWFFDHGGRMESASPDSVVQGKVEKGSNS